QLHIAVAAAAKGLHLGQVDRQVVTGEGEDARLLEARRVMDQNAVGKAQDDRVRIVRRQELPARGGGGERLLVLVLHAQEDARQLAALVVALLDADRELVAELGELADLDRGAERARAQLEAQPLILIFGPGLEIADDA